MQRIWSATVVLVLLAAGRFTASAQMPLTFTEPYLLTLQPAHEMNVCWITSEPVTKAYVEYGLTPQYGSRVEADQYRLEGLKKSKDAATDYNPNPDQNPDLEAYQQIATLRGLKPGQVYYYRVVTKAGQRAKTGAGYYFRTAPRANSPVSFVLLSDLQQKPQILSTVKLAGQTHPDFIIYNGDMQNAPWKSGEWFPVPGVYINPAESGKEWFTAMQQVAEGASLLQYAPIFPTPGNHEVSDQRVLSEKLMAVDHSKFNLKIYMQIFRPLYPEQQYGVGGKHWYSADYGSTHIVSLSVLRWHPWDGYEYPGWQIYEDLRPGSAQHDWLLRDLSENKAKHTWVTMHWHMLNRGTDGWIPFATPQPDPTNTAKVVYPEPDYCFNILKPIFETYGVNAVSYGHSHVYERYQVNGVNYIEAASMGNDYRVANDPYHPSGLKPVIEENRFRSFLSVRTGPSMGLKAAGVQASVEADGVGYVGRIFDTFEIAPPGRR